MVVSRAPSLGTVSFDADGRSWVLCLSINALCRLEEAVDDPDEARRLLSGDQTKFATMRAGFWAALTDHHPELTLEDVGNLLHHIGFPDRAGSLFVQAVLVAFPKPDASARPRKATRKA